MKGLIKVPLILAVVIIVVRIGLEQVGAPGTITFIFGVTWLHLLVPLYLGFRIAAAGGSSPFKDLFLAVFFFTLYTRLMVMATYMLAYSLGWSASRFSVEGGGGVGAESALQGMLITPVLNCFFALVAGTILGMILGSITLFIKRRMASEKSLEWDGSQGRDRQSGS